MLRFRANRSCSVLAYAWLFPYTDFGESHDALGRPVLRASFRVGVPGHRRSFSALIDTGGRVTVVAHEVIAAGGGDPIDTGERLRPSLRARSSRCVAEGACGSRDRSAYLGQLRKQRRPDLCVSFRVIASEVGLGGARHALVGAP